MKNTLLILLASLFIAISAIAEPDIVLPKDADYRAKNAENGKLAQLLFPEAYKDGTALNIRFVYLVKSKFKETPSFFDKPTWPLALAAQAALDIQHPELADTSPACSGSTAETADQLKADLDRIKRESADEDAKYQAEMQKFEMERQASDNADLDLQRHQIALDRQESEYNQKVDNEDALENMERPRQKDQQLIYVQPSQAGPHYEAEAIQQRWELDDLQQRQQDLETQRWMQTH